MHLVIGKMVHSRYECLWHMPGYLDSDPSTHISKMLGMAMPVCNPSAVGKKDRRVVGACCRVP